MDLKITYSVHIICSLLLLCSCSGNNVVKEAHIRLAQAELKQSIEKDPSFVYDFPQARSCGYIYIIRNSILLLYDMAGGLEDTGLYKAYSLDDFSYLGELVLEGRGPGELLAPNLSGEFIGMNDDMCCYINDSMLGFSYSLNLTASFDRNRTILEKIGELDKNVLYSVPYGDTLKFVMDIENDKILCHLSDMDGADIQNIGMYHDDIPVSRYISQLSNCIAVNPEAGIVSMPMMSLPQINFWDLNDNYIWSVAVGREYRRWRKTVMTADIESAMKSKLFYNNAVSSSEYVLAIYMDRTIEDMISNFSGADPHIHVFDWNGNFLYH